ncbi:MAG: glycosyltransferase family 9 protein [Candidatus Omnitrophica bacterium]|nr:glycosyltransferase family 9 protein [Candidatus Omnitrophota bacterium]
MENQKIKKILIFGHSNLGDICYDMVVVSPLKKAFPKALISLITSPKGADIGNSIKGVDQVIIFDKHGKDKGLLGYLRFIAMVRAHKFDLAIILRDMQMHYFLGIRKILKYRKSAIAIKDAHVAEKYLMFLEKQGIKVGPAEFEFKFAEHASRYAANLFKDNSVDTKALKVGIMPLAAWPLKCWPIENWNKIIEKLNTEFNAKVFLFGKTGDSEWDKQVVPNISKQAILTIDQSTVSQTMPLIKALDIFIGLDSSFLHFASCMGIETIGLYGATDPNFIYPLFHKQNIIFSNAGLKCMPCYPGLRGGICNAHEPAECMNAISVEHVWQKITNILNQQKKQTAF